MEFRDKSENLIGSVLLDIDEKKLSAVYSFFDPKFNKLGLRKLYDYSMFIIWSKRKNFKYLYLGYYIEELSSMSYKKDLSLGKY